MTRTRKLLIGGLATVAVIGGVVAASADRGGWGHGGPGGRMGMGGMMGMGPMGAVCRGDGAQMADHMMVGLEYKVKPTDAQKPAFEELKSAAKAAALKAKAACPAEPARAADGTRPPAKPAPERLALLEAGLTAQLEAIRTVRPAAEKFYATLSDDQKKALDERRHGGWGKRGDGEGRGGERHGWGTSGEGRGDRGPRGEGEAPQATPDKK
jgi:LTXXQ motif family protein